MAAHENEITIEEVITENNLEEPSKKIFTGYQFKADGKTLDI